TPKWLVRALPADCGAGAHDATPQDTCQSLRDRGALGLASSGNPIRKSWTLSGDHGGSPLLGGGSPPPLTPVQDLLGMGSIVHAAEVTHEVDQLTDPVDAAWVRKFLTWFPQFHQVPPVVYRRPGPRRCPRALPDVEAGDGPSDDHALDLRCALEDGE